jgi:hypothetical protein
MILLFSLFRHDIIDDIDTSPLLIIDYYFAIIIIISLILSLILFRAIITPFDIIDTLLIISPLLFD